MEVKKEDVREVQEMLKQLSPSVRSEDSISISAIPEHCGKILSMLLNLQWFGHTGGKIPPTESARNLIVVRITNLDMSLADFFSTARDMLSKIEKVR